MARRTRSGRSDISADIPKHSIGEVVAGSFVGTRTVTCVHDLTLDFHYELPVDVVSLNPTTARVPDVQETAGGAAGTAEASSGVPVRDTERDCS